MCQSESFEKRDILDNQRKILPTSRVAENSYFINDIMAGKRK